MKKAFLAVALSTATLFLSACSSVTPFTLFEDAYTSCGVTDGVEVLDEGTTLVIDMMGDTDYSGASLYDVYCVIEAVNTPAYIISDIETTNALAGKQSATFDGISVSWSYHPDNGLDIVYHKQ